MKTRNTPFMAMPVLGPNVHLFAVAADIPTSLAINTAGAMLNTAIETLRGAVVDMDATPEASQAWASLYVLAQVAALVESITLDVECASHDTAHTARLQALADTWSNGVIDDRLWDAICGAMARDGCPELNTQEGAH
ncbi:hypothetical protein CKO23_21170 [Thiocystis violacea]|nr:hypothetical protein [Thiocystis violacea]